MDAIVLAGGEGTRLRPLTGQRPKGLTPILGRPLLGLLLDHLYRHGVGRVVLALTRGSASAAIVDALTDDPTVGGALRGKARSLELLFAFEETPLGSGGAIANAASLLGATSDPVLVCNGDLVSNLDLSAMLVTHRSQRAELTIALCEVVEPSRFGVAALDGGGRITTFVEKPLPGTEPSNLANAGFWLFSDSLIAAMDGRAFNRVEDVLFPDMVKAGRAVFGWRHAGYWRDVGTPDAYREAVMDALDRGNPQMADSNWLDPRARIEPSATVRHSAIEARSTVESGATVLDSVLWEDVQVGAGARVVRSVLGAGFAVPAGAVIEDACLVPPLAPQALTARAL